jgi:hypothetical protein
MDWPDASPLFRLRNLKIGREIMVISSLKIFKVYVQGTWEYLQSCGLGQSCVADD